MSASRQLVFLLVVGSSLGVGYYGRHWVRDLVNKYEVVPTAVAAQTLLMFLFISNPNLFRPS